MDNSLHRLDDNLTDLEIACHKAKIICVDLKDSYFGECEPENYFLKCHYEGAGVKTQILMDYLSEMEISIEILREAIEKECEMSRIKMQGSI